MGFKKENYTRMGIAIPVLIGLCLCVFIPKNIANSLNPPGDCSIGVLEEPRPTSRAKGTRNALSTAHTYRNADWVGLKNGRISDGNFISTTLDGGLSSACLTLDNFNFKIPEGSEIMGMEIFIDGKIEGDSTDVRAKNLFLLDSAGNPTGSNFNNAVSLGDDWAQGTENSMWKYGSSGYNWGGILTREWLNSSEFGIHLEVKNHADSKAEVFIDKIEVVIHYKPGASICLGELHKCISFFGPRTADIISYNWVVPPGFKELDDDESKVFNVFLTEATEPGVYQICVDVEYSTGTDQCCRSFEVLDCSPSTVGDRVWEDINGDGIQDDGEPGIEGISLDLYNDIDQVVSNTTSGADGSYAFDNVQFGCYYVKATGLNGYLPSIGDGNFLDGSNGFACTEYFSVDPDVTITDIDLGLVRPAKISGTIWHDTNANGTFDDEPTIEGISIELEGPVGPRTAITDGSGNYTFDDLVPGDYKLTSTLLDRYEFTDSGVGEADVDSDLNSTGMINIDGIISGTEVNDVDGGMFKRGTIGNYVWYDLNVNGLQDDEELGIPGVKVVLTNADGAVTSRTTDSLGLYTLNGVRPGEYHLAFAIGDDYIISKPNAGDDDSIDSDVESLQDAMRTSDFTFTSCDSLSNVDAGFIFKPGTIRGQVWSDDNRDGQRQPDESRQIETTVTLYTSTNQEVDNKIVDGDGTYFFDQLQPGDYYVRFDAVEDHVYSVANTGDDASDSDITDTDDGSTDVITITPDLTVLNVDAGYAYLVSSIAGVVWEDEDRDNKRGADENNLSGIEVNLYTGNSDLVSSTTTDASGNYKFEELRKSDYYITFGTVEDYLFVAPFDGAANENSDVTESITAGSTDNISLDADTDITDIDAGYILEVGTIIGEAWEDIDLDGLNNDQVSFEGVEVKLFTEDNNEVRNTTTDGDGTYTFDLVPVGDYYVEFELPTDFIYTESNGPTSERQNSDVNDANGEGTTEMVSLENQGDEQELDGGYVINQGRLAGIVWKDNDEDGQRQQEESGMDGVEIKLYDNTDNEVAKTTSTGAGDYSFEEITAGNYYIKVDIPDDNIFTPADQGDDATDSDITETNGEGTSDMLAILTGRRTTNADVGSVDNFGNILGVAWCDVNEDGILEASEELIDDINVDLVSEEGIVLQSTTTAQGGAYAFLEVPAGGYYLVFEDEADKNFTSPNVGNDDLFNSSVNSSITNGSSFVFRIVAGNDEYIRNAGYQYLPGSITGQAWKDDNSNALNDDNTGFEGVSIRLFDNSNNEVNSTVTDASGNYDFQDIRRGDYYVVFGSDDDYLMIPATQSADSKITDSTAEGGTNIFEVIANRETADIDGGYLYARGSVSGNAWIDVNDNGLDDDNGPFQNVTVTLSNAAGEVSSTSTDGNGNYVFSDIYFGEYYITFASQENYLFAQADAGDDTLDSDITGANGDGSTATFQILPNTNTADIDGGYFLAVGSVSGTAWIDDNDNATNDENNGFEGIEVTLFSTTGEQRSTTTSADGSYLFENVLMGDYNVSFQTQSDYDFVAPGNGTEDMDSDVTGANGAGSTDQITVNPRIETMHIDAGYVLGKGTISGTAWIDDNDNSTNDDNNGYEGIEVTLLTSTGDRTSTTTSSDGSYTFKDIFPGNYTLSFETREDYEFVTPNTGDDTTDSDVTGTNGEGSTDEISVGPREDVTNVDAGYLLLTGSVSGTAWADTNNNSINDDDAGIEGLEVTLITSAGEQTQTTTTNSDGYYLFEDVVPGSYSISFETRPDFDFVIPFAGDDAVDSDVTGASGEGTTDIFAVRANQETAFLGAGYKLATGTISGQAWMDINGNDINDDDMAYEGIEVTLLTATGERTTAITDADGNYSFDRVIPGTYSIVFEGRENYEFVTPNTGDEDQDSDVTGANGDGSTDDFTVSPREDVMNIDGGYYMLRGGIAGSTWKDENRNGIYDNESPFAEVSVTLYREDGEELATVVTNENGNYMFDDLSSGNYYLIFEAQDNYNFSQAGQGDEDQDSDVTGANGNGSTDVFSVSAGDVAGDIDAGYFIQTGSICGLVWIDDNSRDGINSDGDEFGANVLVSLEYDEGRTVLETITDADGGYCFNNLNIGEYRVRFSLADGQEYVAPKQGDDPGRDSDVTDRDNGRTDIINLMDGDGLFYDAGIQTTVIEKGSISGKAWKDNNGDNVYNEGDDLIEGLGINLLSDIGAILGTTATGPDGTYSFDDLDDGRYVVFFENKDGQEFVVEGVGDNRATDSDVISTVDTTGSFGITDVIIIEGGQDIVDIDAGIFMEMMVELGSVSGTAFRDDNDNNINDDNSGLSGIEVRLFNGTGEELANTTTNDRGNYTFTDLDDGSYYVVFEDRDNFEFAVANEGDDDTIDSDVTGSNGNGSTDPFDIVGASDIENIDAGYFTEQELYSIRGKAFVDANGNNIDNEESGLAGVQVFLLDTLDMELAVTATDAEGNYGFSNLESNSYVVVFAQASERDFVVANEGDDDTIDSDVEFIQDGLGATNVIVLDSSVDNVDVGFTEIEIVQKGSICGTAWNDLNKNNINDDNAPLVDVEVILYNDAGEEQAVAMTDNSGNYTFSDLDEGDYYVFFDVITDYQYVSAREGEDTSIDSDVTGDNGVGTTNTVSISGDEKIEDLDAGYFTEQELYSIRGKAFIDTNDNNINDGEDGLAGVQVALLDSLDMEVAVAVTDGDGNYAFNGLVPNSYVVVFTQVAERDFVAANEGDDDTVDSDVAFIQDGFGATSIIVLSGDRNNVDAGYTDIEITVNGSISGRTWKDNNGNGINDDESPLAGVEVILVDSLDMQISVTTTDEAGNYTFADLAYSTYGVVFKLPSAHTFTRANQGGDDTIDSDAGFIQIDQASTRLIILNGNVTNVDAGYIPDEIVETGSISGLAWRDINSNHIDDDNTPYAGVEVKLLDESGATLETATTDTEGRYTFNDLEDGTYTIQFENKEQNEFSNLDEGDDDTIDSDVIDSTGTTAQIVIVDNIDVDNIDAGYISDQSFYSISGSAWIDADEDNLNNDEAPFEGIQVFLIDSIDTRTATTTTDSLGNYTFENVVEGTYAVVFTLAGDYKFSNPNVGEDDTIDSDVLFTQNNLGSTDKIVLDADVDNIDAGYIGVAIEGLSIAGEAFIDTDENGLNDDDAPYANVVVALLDTSGVEITRTSTDDMGAYSFSGLDTAAYNVSFWIDSTYVFTMADVGEDDTIDSDVTNIGEGNGSTANIDLMESVTDIDAGYISTDTTMVEMGSLAGVVWEDTSTDGIRQGDEPGVGNVEVRLIDNNGEQVETTSTGQDGNYSFENINVGTYTVRFVVGDEQTFVLADIGEDDTVDSDVIDGEGNTAAVMVIADSTLQNVDAGILTELPQASLCGFVWIDGDENGINDEAEDKVIGILINIYNENGEYVDSTRTTTGGFYSFTDLLGGFYYLEFDTEGDYIFTEANVGEDGGLDSDVTGENGEGTTPVFLGSGKIKLDAGLIPETGSYISGKVWGDTDEDNTFGDNDILIEGHEVFLVNRLARVIGSTVTDANGEYRFEPTTAGEYAIFFATNDEITFVEADASGDDKTDSDVIDVLEINGTFGTTNLINFTPGQRIKNVDAGIEATVVMSESLAGVVWMDDNEDGIRQPEEILLAGIEVNVYNASEELVVSTTTDSDGAYTFSDLASGDYVVQFVIETGEFVAANQGDDDTVDSDVVDLENGNTASFTFESGTVQTFDAGVMGDVQVNAICGTVWNDEDQNGLNNAEQGRRDVKVYLQQAGEVVDSTSTSTDGTYAFANLETGNYRIVVETLDGYTFAGQDVGEDDTIDSDVNGNGISAEVSVDGKVTIDAGVSFSVVGITGKVWGDRNEDNVFGEEDILIEGHMVFLLNRTARVIQTTVTAADGTYRFEGVMPGTYGVFFDVGVDDLFVEPNASTDESKDSDVTEIITQIGPYAVTSFFDYEENGTVRNIDAGLIRTPGSTGLVAGVVWLDNEQDGIRQEDEELFSGIDVTLFTIDGAEVSTATTDENGAYQFDDVAPGEYYIVFTVLGRDFVAANQGDDDRVDSDVEDLASGRTANFDVEVEVTTMMDAGILPAQTGVFGVVWFDFNENGQRDNDEMGIPDIEVKLFNSSTEEVGATMTDETGAYSFSDIDAGDYYVQISIEGAFLFTEMKVGDEATDSDITEANGDGTSDVFTFEGGLTQIDAGKISIVPSIISGKVWEDKDGDNIRNNDDELVGGFNVYLQLNGNIIDTTVTEPDGTYMFSDLAVGQYQILFEQMDGMFFALANIAEEESLDSDVLGTIEIDGKNYGFTEEISIGSGEVISNVDAGITQTELNPGSIAGEIWLDQNDDGINDEDEGPVEGVFATLYDNDGSTIEMLSITAEGTYKFENLAPGLYAVQFTIPAEYNFVEPGQGEPDRDSDVVLIDEPIGVTNVITLMDGQDLENIDAGLKPITVNFSTIGDQVWLDIDEDGVLDVDEIGMNDVTVELYNAGTDNLVASMLTIDHPELRDPGFYEFTDLPNGDYYLKFKLPSGYIFSNPRMGTEMIKDSDVTGANGTGTTNTVTVDRIKMTDIDVGAIKTDKSVIGDFVFNDRNSNGIQDTNEDGINNIRVRLFDTEKRQVAQTFTQYNRAMDRGGYFSFKVDPGTYYLRFDISQGLSFTENDLGDNDERDSDVNGENGFGTTSLFEVGLAETNLSLDAGLITEPANLGNYLWVDANSNGVQDADEDGYNGVEVSLYDKDSNLMISTTTSSNNGQDGYYLFENISAGQYYVGFDLPEEYVSTVPNVGGNDAEDSDITDVFGKGTTSLFTLSSGEDELDIDGGIVLSSSIGDYVWEDTDGDGIQDNDEVGAEGVFIRLTDGTGAIVDTTRTDIRGEYRFDGLRTGEYILEFELPIDRAATSQDSGSDDDTDSDIDEDGVSATIVIGYNEDVDNVDLGLVSNTVAFSSTVENELIAKVYPNPTIRFITISTANIYQEDTELKELHIFDSQGALVRSYTDLKTFKNGGDRNYEVDLEGVQAGIYYLKAKVGKLTYKQKLILINN